ncbi:hypothetical protein B0I37DRAFT_123527 [Chaetomium sp. MPI-CAGE-AT-0009]|nr:hypothetical protein B0I37DRAFT_123527 [Chaetomium sp. MPI-CAGE-AT-0009]
MRSRACNCPMAEEQLRCWLFCALVLGLAPPLSSDYYQSMTRWGSRQLFPDGLRRLSSRTKPRSREKQMAQKWLSRGDSTRGDAVSTRRMTDWTVNGRAPRDSLQRSGLPASTRLLVCLLQARILPIHYYPARIRFPCLVATSTAPTVTGCQGIISAG